MLAAAVVYCEQGGAPNVPDSNTSNLQSEILSTMNEEEKGLPIVPIVPIVENREVLTPETVNVNDTKTASPLNANVQKIEVSQEGLKNDEKLSLEVKPEAVTNETINVTESIIKVPLVEKAEEELSPTTTISDEIEELNVAILENKIKKVFHGADDLKLYVTEECAKRILEKCPSLKSAEACSLV